ncbi:MAG: type II toxin-antitoxin system RelE/ParE family toxin [Flexilinea sp.]|nr:type II toxin-antitoxin system RelE/ParE family toxin [Flexilinea sp.]
MTYFVHLSEKPDRDIRDIYEYIAQTLYAPMNAATVFNRISEAILSLNEMPERHQIYKTGSNGEEIRFLVTGNHIIYYLVDHSKAQVNVIRVLYGGMDIDKELDSWV